ncbi:MAG TPA: Gfo/Idh/MocA family oxidoreductase [Gemmataceae bacterium]|nr:Gfo/Idh/MocA family oxidoreductase [Gemmataceae bacterium]
MTRRVSRRRFLAAATAAAGYFTTAPAHSAGKIAGSNGRLRLAGVGVGGKGSGDITQAGQLGEVVALCDADANTLGRKAREFPQAEKFFDFRAMFDELGRQIDAVTVSTPDHTHAAAALLAMRTGKHVYVQKPLTRTVYEAHLLMRVAKEKGVCTQMGNQGTAHPGLRRGVELVQAGTIGPVKEVHVWTNRPIWPQAPLVTKRPPEVPVPRHVHWDEWLGPAPARPYAEYPKPIAVGRRKVTAPYHPFAWRGWWDFGTGAIGDMACHTANLAFLALKLTQPTRVSAEAGDVNPETCPSYAHVTMQFPARGELPPVTLHWYEGRKNGEKLTPPREMLARVLKPDERLADSGSMLVGEKGILFSPNDNGAAFRIVGEVPDGLNLTRPEKLPAYEGPTDPNQKREWVEAIQAGKPSAALSNFDYAALLTSSFLLGNVAIRTGRPVEWDAATLTARGGDGVAALIKPEYRKGWDLG